MQKGTMEERTKKEKARIKEARLRQVEDGLEELSENRGSKVMKALLTGLGEETVMAKIEEHRKSRLQQLALMKWRAQRTEVKLKAEVSFKVAAVFNMTDASLSVEGFRGWRLRASRRQYQQEIMAQANLIFPFVVFNDRLTNPFDLVNLRRSWNGKWPPKEAIYGNIENG